MEALAGCHAALEATLGLLGLWHDQPQVLLAELRALALVRCGGPWSVDYGRGIVVRGRAGASG